MGKTQRACHSVLLITVLLHAATGAEAPQQAHPLTASTLDDAWRSHDRLLVEFYVDGSESHALLAGVLPAAVASAAASGAAVHWAAVDMEREARLRKRFGIPEQGPRHDRSVLRLFHKGLPEPVPYLGALAEQEVVEFLTRSTQPPARTIGSVREAVVLTEGSKPVVLGFFEPHDVKEYEAFLAAAKLGRSSSSATDPVVFAEVLEPALIKEFDIVYTPMVFVFKPKHDAIGYVGKYEPLPLLEWVQANALDLVGELRPDNFLHVLTEDRPALVLFHSAGSATVAPLLEHMAHAAASTGNDVTYLHASRAHYDGLATRLGLGGPEPALAILDFATRQHYLFAGNGSTAAASADEVSAFVAGYLSGGIPPANATEGHAPFEPSTARSGDAHAKSGRDGADADQIEASSSLGGILHMPASLEDVPETVVVANPRPDVLMDFYVPWCDFYIHISVPSQGDPHVAIPLALPEFGPAAGAAAEPAGAAAVDAAASVAS